MCRPVSANASMVSGWSNSRPVKDSMIDLGRNGRVAASSKCGGGFVESVMLALSSTTVAVVAVVDVKTASCMVALMSNVDAAFEDTAVSHALGRMMGNNGVSMANVSISMRLPMLIDGKGIVDGMLNGNVKEESLLLLLQASRSLTLSWVMTAIPALDPPTEDMVASSLFVANSALAMSCSSCTPFSFFCSKRFPTKGRKESGLLPASLRDFKASAAVPSSLALVMAISIRDQASTSASTSTVCALASICAATTALSLTAPTTRLALAASEALRRCNRRLIAPPTRSAERFFWPLALFPVNGRLMPELMVAISLFAAAAVEAADASRRTPSCGPRRPPSFLAPLLLIPMRNT
mmetsp:Transcript_9617/g.20819  ORF Transcript_9617/g.20819 Transcript_9617/m.20819 type:complete len:352 (-) Transcript_9617:867-1922(-)